MHNIRNATSHFLFISVVGIVNTKGSKEAVASTSVQSENGRLETELGAHLTLVQDLQQCSTFFSFHGSLGNALTSEVMSKNIKTAA